MKSQKWFPKVIIALTLLTGLWGMIFQLPLAYDFLEHRLAFNAIGLSVAALAFFVLAVFGYRLRRRYGVYSYLSFFCLLMPCFIFASLVNATTYSNILLFVPLLWTGVCAVDALCRNPTD